MKQIFTLCCFLLLATQASAQGVWTVKSVPNTRLESDMIHVSDPDDILSDSCERLINTALSEIRERADVFVVALGSIGDADIEVFANELFNYWGIGDRDKDNGVLILLAKEQRELKFETGYGVEKDLTDARCQKIFMEHIVPFFKEGDYQGGLCSGVTQVVEVFGGAVPDGLLPVLPSRTDVDVENDFSAAEMLLFLLLMGMPFIGFFVFVIQFVNKKNGKGNSVKVLKTNVVDGVRYVSGKVNKWDGNPWEGVGCLKGLLIGLSPLLIFFIVNLIEIGRMGGSENLNNKRVLLITIFVYLTWVCVRQNWRALRITNKVAKEDPFPQALFEQADKNRLTRLTRWLAIWVGWIFILIFKHKIEKTPACRCVECGGEMGDFKRFHFSQLQQKEMALKSVSYNPYICPYGHVTVVKSFPSTSIRYQDCPVCQGHTVRVADTKIIRNANYDHSGLKEVTNHCEFCGHSWVVEETIPKLFHYYSGSGSSSSSSSSYHSSSHHSSGGYSHHSGGSFGGGHSGGGGFKGKW